MTQVHDLSPSSSGPPPSSIQLFSLVIPAFNEGPAIADVLTRVRASLIGVPCEFEIIVVDDGSRDDTTAKALTVPDVRVLRNPVNLGYGHSLLRGIAEARGDIVGISDADGTYPEQHIPMLLDLITRGADMAIGARTGAHFQSHFWLRHFYRLLCRYVAGQSVPDANSGLRIFRRAVVESLRGDLCRGFSFTTSLTLASVLSGYVVVFRDIPYSKRVGRSHVRPRDVLRTLQYLFQLVALYNPLKLFLPLVVTSFTLALSSLLWAAWTHGSLVPSSVLGATTLLLTGLSAQSYIVSRVGLYPAHWLKETVKEEAGRSSEHLQVSNRDLESRQTGCAPRDGSQGEDGPRSWNREEPSP